jgi:hypothetical protein
VLRDDVAFRGDREFKFNLALDMLLSCLFWIGKLGLNKQILEADDGIYLERCSGSWTSGLARG